MKELEPAIAAHLAKALGHDVRLESVSALAGGSCQDNFRVELEDQGERRVLVLRADAVRSLRGSLSRRLEHGVINRAVRAGVKTPEARYLAEGLTRDGASSYFMNWVPGVAIGRRVLRDADLAIAREGLARELADELARIHTVTPADDDLGLAAPTDPIKASLASTYAAVDAMPERRPALELALRWLVEHPPRDRAVSLCHGDFRTGNFLVTPAGLAAVLDWEFAHWGCPAEDVAWLCMRNWRFSQNDKEAGGFARRSAFYREYERASGKPLDARDVHYWEVLGNVRWAAGCVEQGVRYFAEGEHDLELVAIPRRAVEMEFEALRLIQKGIP